MVRLQREFPAIYVFLKWILFAWIACLPAHAQSDFQTLPEVDAHLTVSPSLRFYLQAKDDRDGGDPVQFLFGPSIQYYRKPLITLNRDKGADLDTAKSRVLVWETGYRIVTAPGVNPTNRLIVAFTSHFPLPGKILAGDRNRADLDWQSGTPFNWRYRNRLMLQRTISIGSYHPIPYVSVEPFYESKYGKWSTTQIDVGSTFPVGKHVEFDVYYQHQNNTGKSPNQVNNFLGLAMHMYFSSEKQSPSPPGAKAKH